MKIPIRFSATYTASPIFNASPEDMGYVDLSDMGLPQSLEERIDKWDQEFQDTYCAEYPPDSKFSSMEQLNNHNMVGLELSALLQDFLGSNYFVEFIPQQ